MNKLAILIASALLALSSVNATTIAWWDFSELPGGRTFPTGDPRRVQHGPDGFEPEYLAPGVKNPEGLQRGNEGTNHNGNPRRGGSWGGVNFMDTSYKSAVKSGRYYEFTLEFDFGTIIELTLLEGYFFTSATGPDFAQWAYSINGNSQFTKIGEKVYLPGDASVHFDIDLKGIVANWEETDSITFRVVAWREEPIINTTGSFYFDGRTKSRETPGLALYGEMIPEPSVALLLGIGAAFIACRRKKRSR